MIPETDAARRIGAALSKYHDAKRWHTDAFWTELGAKVVAHRGYLSAVFRDLDNDPHTIPNDRPQLRQQRVNEVESLEWFIQEAHYHRHAMDEALDMIDRLTARAAAEREHDVDEREQDRENHRLREQRQDERASENAPRVAS